MLLVLACGEVRPADDRWYEVDSTGLAGSLPTVPTRSGDAMSDPGRAGVASEGVPILPDPRDAGATDGVVTPRLAAGGDDLRLFAGEVRVLDVPGLSRVAIGNGALVETRHVEPDQLVLIAEAPGTTSLHLWFHDNRQSSRKLRILAEDPDASLELEPMVRMQVRMIEFRRSALESLGIDWTPDVAARVGAAIGDAVDAGGVPGTGMVRTVFGRDAVAEAGLMAQLRSRLDLMFASGDATVLAEPVLSCASGATASFLAGGEVPYPIVDDGGTSRIQFKEYGVRLEVSPRIDRTGRVRTLVDTEISQLDAATSIGGTPGLLTRRARTDVHVQSGDTVVISGLLTHERGGEVEGLPGIARVPVLGRLFRSRRRRQATTELVIFVTPEVIDTAYATAGGGPAGARRSNAVARFDRLLGDALQR